MSNQIANKSRVVPMKGEEYLESLRDGREVWVNGEKVKDITTHPAFRNSVASIAMLYDSLHDGSNKSKLLTNTDTGSGGLTHPFFKLSKSKEELRAARDGMMEWQKMTYGWMGRTPDFMAAYLVPFGAETERYGEFSQNASNLYRSFQENMWHFSHILVNPVLDRHKSYDTPIEEVLHVVKETDVGVVVSGAKQMGTGAATTNSLFSIPVIHIIEKEEYAIGFTIPTGTEGVKIYCRPSFEYKSSLGSPFDSPLASRFDENDAMVIFENVLIPWENILVYRDIEKAKNFFTGSSFLNYATLHGVTRFAIKMDFMIGLLLKLVKDVSGTIAFRGVQAQVGEAIAYRHAFWAMSEAMISDAELYGDGYYKPNTDHGQFYRVFAPQAWHKIKEIFEQVGGGALMSTPSDALDMKNQEQRPFIDKYYRGIEGKMDALERTKLIRLIWDTLSSEFAGRHALYERSYVGNHENVRMEALRRAIVTGMDKTYESFVEECMEDYDLDGWSRIWINS